MEAEDFPRSDDDTAPVSRQLVLDWGHEEARSEADFMVTDDNRLAFDHVQAWPHWPVASTVILGAAKAGKTHLAGLWLARADAVAATPQTLEALVEAGGGRAVLVEDVDRRAYPEAALFHLLNAAVRGERHVLLTARAPAAEWRYGKADVISRARLATTFTIAAPDDMLLSQMLVKLFADRQLPVDPKVISYLVARMERSSAEAVALASLLDTLSLSRRKPITRALAADALALRDQVRRDR